ncbi:hypothetical protein LTR85_011753 [Meristemomyces frigidus]|nr:hypothetical protein LTR85_011753 [Meristemomyces frigidus]
MQYALVLAAAALAHAHEYQHGRLHGKRSTVTNTVVEDVYVTVTEYVTAASSASSVTVELKNHWHSWSHSSAASSSSEVSSAPASTSAASVYTPTSSSTSSVYVSPVAYSSSSSAATTLATSTSVYSSTSAYTSSASVASFSSAASTSSAAASSTGITVSNLTPNGKKAGLSGYIGIGDIAAFSDLAPYISWYSDYTPNTPDEQGVMGIGMLWGASGSACGDVVTEREDTFNSMIKNDTIPEIMFGFYEPDCTCDMSSDMSVADAAADWTDLIAPLKDQGTVLGSPSMCKQKDEDFLTPFNSSITTTWDVTAVHINKPNVSEAMKDVDYYLATYGKPIWVAEFACVNDEPDWEPCTDQDQINSFINDCVSYFQGNESVVAYGPSNGEGLGDVWPLTDSSTGELTTSGTTYLNAIKGL